MNRSIVGNRASLRSFLLKDLNRNWHRTAVFILLAIASAHLAEHLVQVGQVFLLDWARPDAGGLLGLVFRGAAENELLHLSYNTLQLTGLILLAPGFRVAPDAGRWWIAALVAQCWHWLEHAFLIVQLATGVFFYGALKQMSVMERLVPRIELHFAYNLLVYVPTAIAVLLYLSARRRKRGAA